MPGRPCAAPRASLRTASWLRHVEDAPYASEIWRPPCGRGHGDCATTIRKQHHALVRRLRFRSGQIGTLRNTVTRGRGPRESRLPCPRRVRLFVQPFRAMRLARTQGGPWRVPSLPRAARPALHALGANERSEPTAPTASARLGNTVVAPTITSQVGATAGGCKLQAGASRQSAAIAAAGQRWAIA